jgi:hypothetical protein
MRASYTVVSRDRQIDHRRAGLVTVVPVMVGRHVREREALDRLREQVEGRLVLQF